RPEHDTLDVTLVPTDTWDNRPLNPATNPNNLMPPPACNLPTSTFNFTGLRYYYGFFITALYTHTVPPNSQDRDCLRTISFDQGHLASGSYHPGGVNIVLADGSVRFVSDGISLATWKKLGTRSGGEVIDPGDF